MFKILEKLLLIDKYASKYAQEIFLEVIWQNIVVP